ncbi:hypothetical protein [Kitasatospora aureofaciens]|uniref:hypothetical protein n=1 Tax=Kitasatospora aureofaciens TaxID=1894 RepID=UPI0037F381B9
MKRVNLTAGGWADLREPNEIPERLRRPVRKLQMLMAGNPAFSTVVEQATGADGAPDVDEAQAAQMAAAMGESGIDLVFQLQDRSILQRVAGWSFGDVTLDVLQDLAGDVYDELSELCKDPAAGSVDLRPSMDETSPTVPSTA